MLVVHAFNQLQRKQIQTPVIEIDVLYMMPVGQSVKCWDNGYRFVYFYLSCMVTLKKGFGAFKYIIHYASCINEIKIIFQVVKQANTPCMTRTMPQYSHSKINHYKPIALQIFRVQYTKKAIQGSRKFLLCRAIFRWTEQIFVTLAPIWVTSLK